MNNSFTRGIPVGYDPKQHQRFPNGYAEATRHGYHCFSMQGAKLGSVQTFQEALALITKGGAL